MSSLKWAFCKHYLFSSPRERDERESLPQEAPGCLSYAQSPEPGTKMHVPCSVPRDWWYSHFISVPELVRLKLFCLLLPPVFFVIIWFWDPRLKFSLRLSNDPFTEWISGSSSSCLFPARPDFLPLPPPFPCPLPDVFPPCLPPFFAYHFLLSPLPSFSLPTIALCNLPFVQCCQAGHLMDHLRKKTDAALDLQGLHSDERDRTWTNPLQHVQTKCLPGHQEIGTLIFQRKGEAVCRAGREAANQIRTKCACRSRVRRRKYFNRDVLGMSYVVNPSAPGEGEWGCGTLVPWYRPQ